MPVVRVHSDAVTYTDTAIESRYVYAHTRVSKDLSGDVHVTPEQTTLSIRTQRHVPRTGVMLVGWGGNNGSTLTAGLLAQRQNLTWRTRRHGLQSAAASCFGSITQSSTLNMGMTADLEEVFVPMRNVVPMLCPTDIVVGGWDCSGMNLGEAMRRAGVLEVAVQNALYPCMSRMTPLPGLFNPDFVAENQRPRADHVLPCESMWHAVEQLRADIRHFSEMHELEKVLVLWTASTERMSAHRAGVHDSAEHLIAAVKANRTAEIAPSLLYAIAAVLEGCSYINGAPQNTICPGLVDLARRHGVFVAGDDFKSGQTKIKSALVEFFVGAGIKPECIASYNHLGNNDGLNLSAAAQFRSKEMTKRNVIDDMVASNELLYPPGSRAPDHAVVIQYLPYVGDSKRAMDEYTCSIFMGGQQTVVMHNTCEDSLLAAPLILDLVVLTELMERVTIRTHISSSDGDRHEHDEAAHACRRGGGSRGAVRHNTDDENKAMEEEEEEYEHVDTVLSILSYLFKAPAVPDGTPVVNALTRQKQAIENILRAMVGLPPENNMLLECRVPALRAACTHA